MFLGPFRSSKTFGDFILPSEESLFPLLDSPSIDNRGMFKYTTKIFRAFPPSPDRHRAWFDRVRSSKHQSWVREGFADFVSLFSHNVHVFEPHMLLAALCFWNREIHAFEFPCGFIAPTLLDIASLIVIRPSGEVYFCDRFDDAVRDSSLELKWDKKTYSHFCAAHQGAPDTPVSDTEHIAFLMYWLSSCVFCSPSLQVPKSFFNLASLLHREQHVSLSKLLLAALFSALDDASEALSKGSPKNLVGPLWLLQLWLNSIFESSLPPSPSSTQSFSFEDCRFSYLTPSKKDPSNFHKFLGLIASFEEFIETLAPTLRLDRRGPQWLIEAPLHTITPSLASSTHSFWLPTLHWDVIFWGMRRQDVRSYCYHPQLFSR
ncbi:hypothetical protein Fmac_026129 [Flemingia macrophylla]|uniref:Aminotransferase-like plant mobile domain-containing protein n=1 Tax=Flemingia macrophylla TaxID=520843 RepID=A0ABD1LDZ5_9FABA